MTPRITSAADVESLARTHQQAIELFRRPFAPGAIGFRAMSKVPYNGDPWGGAHIAAYLGAQSVLQRLNAVVPGRWRMTSPAWTATCWPPPPTAPPPPALPGLPAARHTPQELNGPDVEAVYEDIGECDAGSLAGLKALYSDARKRAGVAAGIGAYLYTALAAVVLPIGPGDRQVQCLRRSGKSDLLTLSPATEAWLREGYRARMHTDTVAARPRPDPGPRRTRRRHRPRRKHRHRRPPQPRTRRHQATATAPERPPAPRTGPPATAAANWSRSTSASLGPTAPPAA